MADMTVDGSSSNQEPAKPSDIPVQIQQNMQNQFSEEKAAQEMQEILREIGAMLEATATIIATQGQRKDDLALDTNEDGSLQGGSSSKASSKIVDFEREKHSKSSSQNFDLDTMRQIHRDMDYLGRKLAADPTSTLSKAYVNGKFSLEGALQVYTKKLKDLTAEVKAEYEKAKNTSTTTETNQEYSTSTSYSYAALSQALVAATNAMGQMQYDLSQVSSNKAEADNKINQAYVDDAEKSVEDALDLMEKIEHLKHKMKVAEKNSQIMSICMGIACCLGAALVGPEMFMLAATMFVMQESGGMTAMTEALAHSIHKGTGLNEKDAMTLADITIAGSFFVAGVGVAGMAGVGAKAAEAGAEAGAESGAESGAEAGNLGLEAGSETGSIAGEEAEAEAAAKASANYATFKIGLMVGFMALSTTNFWTDLAKSISKAGGGDESDWETALMVIGMIATLGACWAGSTVKIPPAAATTKVAEEEAAEASEGLMNQLTSFISRNYNSMKNSETLQRMYQVAKSGIDKVGVKNLAFGAAFISSAFTLGKTACDYELAYWYRQEGRAQREMDEAYAASNFYQDLGNTIESSVEFYNDLIANLGESTKNLAFGGLVGLETLAKEM
jgi:hypothetical protein